MVQLNLGVGQSEMIAKLLRYRGVYQRLSRESRATITMGGGGGGGGGPCKLS